MKLFEYRCVREYPYRNCTQFPPLDVRQGEYILAENADKAIKQMIKKYPEDHQHGYGFVVQKVKQIS